MMFASLSPRRLNRDPEPYVSNRDGQRYPTDWHGVSTIDYAPRPECDVVQHNPENIILDVIRDCWDKGDPWGSSSEALIQLARHWADWQSERMGTFPLDYSDPSGPSSRRDAEETGEDALYWYIDDTIRDYLTAQGASVIDDGDTFDWHGPQSLGDTVQDMIAHAVRVLSRLSDQAKLAGRDY